MARNSEKAMLLLNRWHEMKMAITGGAVKQLGARQARPRRTEEVNSLRDAEYWRNNVMREVSMKIAEIQNAGLGESRLLALNDEINRLLSEKNRWETQIKKLGGPDYASLASSVEQGFVASRSGYRYFGAARELKIVKEQQLLSVAEPRGATRPSRAELARRVRPQYFGYSDETLNSDIVTHEAGLERSLREQWIEGEMASPEMATHPVPP